MKENNFKNNRTFLTVKEVVSQKAKETIFEKLKNHFGNTYNIANNMGIIDSVCKNFIKKYDKKYELHRDKTIESNYNKLKHIEFLVKLEKGTYMYVMNKPDSVIFFNHQILQDESFAGFTIYIFGKKMRKYSKELEEVFHEINWQNNYIYEISPTHDKDSSSFSVYGSELSKRDLNTLYFSNNEKEIICKHLDHFYESKDFYEKRSLIFKTGILLYGDPGTGKSSLAKAIATKYGMSIINIKVSALAEIDLTELSNVINNDSNERKYLILLEDLDTLYLNRVVKDSESDPAANDTVINSLLQFLDSNSSPNNVVFLATTNHLDRLDEALLRNGRFDLKVNVLELNYNEALEFGRSFDLSDTVVSSLLDEVMKSDGKYTQCKLQNLFLSKIQNKSLDVINEMYKIDDTETSEEQ